MKQLSVNNILTSGTHEVASVKAVNIKADSLLEDNGDVAFEKDLFVFDSIPMDLLSRD